MSERAYDAIIAGGGIAGAVAAFHLAKRGYRALLVEQAPGPHHKVCGEFMSAEMRPYLDEMGLDLTSLGAAPIRTLNLYAKNVQVSVELSNEASGLSRYRLDEVLLQKAQDAGACVRRGLTVTAYEKTTDDRPFIVRTTGPTFRGSALFVATGKYNDPRLHRRTGRETSAIAFKVHLKPAKEIREQLRHHIALFLYKGGYAGFSPVENDLYNFCFIIDKEIYHAIGNRYSTALQYLQAQNETLRQILNGSQSQFTKPLTAANIPYGYLHKPDSRENKKPDLYYLGDQFAVIPSFTGTGMAIAALTGKWAVEQYDRKRTDCTSHDESALYELIASKMKLAYPLHVISRFPLCADLAVLLFKCSPALLRRVVERTRCPQQRMRPS